LHDLVRAIVKAAPDYNRLLKKNKDTVLGSWPDADQSAFKQTVQLAKEFSTAWFGLIVSGDWRAIRDRSVS